MLSIWIPLNSASSGVSLGSIENLPLTIVTPAVFKAASISSPSTSTGLLFLSRVCTFTFKISYKLLKFDKILFF